jgi:hypothetical protein
VGVTVPCAYDDQSEGIDDDDQETYRYLTLAFSRLAQSMEEDFTPFLPSVLPPIMELASRQVVHSSAT